MRGYSAVPKVVLPRVAGILQRDRLIRRLDASEDKKLILVLGQAAQGKSTLAASYASRSTMPCAWISLSREDSDPANLFYLVLQSLQQAIDDIDLSSLPDCPAISLGPRAKLPLYRYWINSIFEHIRSPVRIVLDGLDQMLPTSTGFLRTLLHDSPVHVRFLLISRTWPPLDLNRFRLDGDLLTIDNSQLAFTLDETEKYFKNIQHLPLSHKSIREIHKMTEGWPGGLTLLSESLRRFSSEGKTEKLPQVCKESFKAEVFEYFKEQVFSLQPERIRRFLIYSSILEIIEPGIAKELTGIEDGERILSVLAERNLFVQTVYDEKRGYLYRHHQLFRDFLRAKFETATSERQRRLWLHKAGSLYGERDDWHEAVRYYLEARAYQEAVRIIERLGLEMVREGRSASLAEWIGCIPEELLKLKPWLLLYRCIIRRFSDVEENSRILPQIVSSFEQSGDLRGEILSLAQLIETLTIRGRDSVPMVSLLERGEALLEMADDDAYRYETGALWLQVGFANIIRGGDPRKGLYACQNALLIAENLKDPVFQALALIYIIASLAWLGEFSPAGKCYEKLSQLVEKHPNPELRALQLIVYSGFLLAKGEIEQARETISEAGNEAEEHGLMYLYPLSLLYDFIIKISGEDYPEAKQTGNRLMIIARSSGNLVLTGRTLLWLGILHYRTGAYERAEKFFRESKSLFSSKEALTEGHLTVCKLYLALTSLKGAESERVEAGTRDRELVHLLKRYEEMSNHLFVVHLCFVLALRCRNRNLTAETVEYLRIGFEIARQKRYEHFLFLAPGDVAEVCALSVELKLEECVEYAWHLLSCRFKRWAGACLARLEQHPDPELRQKVRELRHDVQASGLPHIRIETLGEFCVRRGEEPIGKAEWQGNQPKRLLKALIARGGRDVPIDLLIEDLWPDKESNAGKAAFAVNLHRLRKILEPKFDRRHTASHIHLKANLVSLDEKLCSIDVEELVALMRQAEEKQLAGQVKETTLLYGRILDIYRGDFLKEELYADWAHGMREDLRKRFLESLLKMAAFHEAKGAFKNAILCCQRALRADPLLETAYQKLMLLLSSRGKLTAAVRLYEECKDRLQSALGVEPDDLTKAIYRKILVHEDARQETAHPGSCSDFIRIVPPVDTTRN